MYVYMNISTKSGRQDDTWRMCHSKKPLAQVRRRAPSLTNPLLVAYWFS